MNKLYIAHFRTNDGEKQPLVQHLKETANISKDNGSSLGIATTCYLAGLLHDAGKYTEAFQQYLSDAHAGLAVVRGSVDHSTYGGKIILSIRATNKYERLAIEMIANSIFAHHSSRGLLDFISGEGDASVPFSTRYEKELPEYDDVCVHFFEEVASHSELESLVRIAGKELETLAIEHDWNPKSEQYQTDQFYFLKLVYSALLDGDRRNTQLFEEFNSVSQTDSAVLFESLASTLETTFETFRKGPETKINTLRQEMADACLQAADRPTGIYRLSIPTGGGKTLSSMRFALNHATKKRKKRIIYIIPYSSIIEQNAGVFRKHLQDSEGDFILEHHSNLVSEQDDQSEDSERKQAKMQDNWDSPIIVTTMVRFLENVFSGSTRNPRRIHQLLDSILIFDEIQSIPPKCLSMFNSLITFLKEYGNTTTLLCTATQPTLENRKVKLPLESDAEIVPDLASASTAFERVKVIDYTKPTYWSAQELADFSEKLLEDNRNLLIILNTKKAVRAVFQELRDRGKRVFHLSTSMSPNHRTYKLEIIREALEKGQDITCVTTPLIEAGVDISFATVIRSISGLDSIAQAAGRCNRNGESSVQQPVYLVNPVKELENIDKMREIKTKSLITMELLQDRKFNHNDSSLLDPKLIERFFNRYYSRVEKANESDYLFNDGKSSLYELMGKNLNRRKFYVSKMNELPPTLMVSSSQTIAKHFNVIEQQGDSVLVEFGEGKEMIIELNGSKDVIFDKRWYQKAQRNSITLYQHEFKQLEQSGLITITPAGIYVLHQQAYDEDFGLNIEGDSHGSYSF